MFWYWNEHRPEDGKRYDCTAMDIMLDVLTVVAAVAIIVGAGWVTR